jgi:hypothetical protein
MSLTRDNILKQLDSLPSKWREQIADALLSSAKQASALDCDQVKNCETVTSLSGFQVSGTSVCVSYKDEKNVTVVRCFDFAASINSSLDGVDPKCITSTSSWNVMTYKQKWQALIDSVCTTCEDAPTTTTSTTTTTTTVDNCPDIAGITGVTFL